MSDAAHSALDDAERESALVAWLRKRGAAIIVFVLLFFAWELSVRVTGIKEYLLPPPSRVYTEFIKRFPTNEACLNYLRDRFFPTEPL